MGPSLALTVWSSTVDVGLAVTRDRAGVTEGEIEGRGPRVVASFGDETARLALAWRGLRLTRPDAPDEPSSRRDTFHLSLRLDGALFALHGGPTLDRDRGAENLRAQGAARLGPRQGPQLRAARWDVSGGPGLHRAGLGWAGDSAEVFVWAYEERGTAPVGTAASCTLPLSASVALAVHGGFAPSAPAQAFTLGVGIGWSGGESGP